MGQFVEKFDAELKEFCEKHFSEAVSSKRYTEAWFNKQGAGHLYHHLVCRFENFPKASDAIKIILFRDFSTKCLNCDNEIYRVDMFKKPWLCRECCKSEKRDNTKKTNVEKYGSASPFGNKDVQNKIRETMDARYGGHSAASPEVQAKMKRTLLERYGEDSPSKIPHMREKAKKTLLTRYGTESNRKASMLRNYSNETLQLFNSPEEILSIYDKSKKPLHVLAEETGIHRFQLSRLLGDRVIKYRRSSYEERLFIEDIEKHFDISLERGSRKIISPLELDAYLEEAKLGIEYHGIYWHSTDRKDVDMRHFHKRNASKTVGISLLQFTSIEVEQRRNQVFSIIASKLGKTKRLFARKCEVLEIGSKEYRAFCENYHLQGSVGASVRLGLFYSGELVSVMSFGKSRYDKKHAWEMIRYCTKSGLTVVGGASKLWKHFLKTTDPESVVTYADARISNGKVYEKLGFTFSHHSLPNYWYVGKNCSTVESRVKYQKHKLRNTLENFDASLTEKENMINSGFRIFYDAGNLVYTWTK